MKNPPVILAIDTSLGACSAAIHAGGFIPSEAEDLAPGSQSRVLIPMIEAVLANAGMDYANLTAVACTIGPGGFTGIRVGLSAARAISLALDIPMIGHSTLETIAFGANLQGDLLSVIDAHRGQFYVQRFRSGEALLAQSDALLVEEKALGTLSHGAKIIRALPHARDAARLAAAKWAAGERDFLSSPLYIREPDAKLPSKQGLKCAAEPL